MNCIWIRLAPGMLVLAAFSAWAQPIPDCLYRGQKLAVDNERALRLKADDRVASGYKEQALVEGKVTQVFPDRNHHDHFIIQIGPGAKDLIEVVYNVSFGEMPDPNLGDSVLACGEYIKSTRQNGGYPPSPAGAIIHWVHKNPRFRPGTGSHDHGYVVLQGALYGWGGEAAEHENGGRRPPRDRDLPYFLPQLLPAFAY